MKVALGVDHGGFDLKGRVLDELAKLGANVIDCGTNNTESVDYPDFAEKVAKLVISGAVDRGILICGTGIGIAIAANKFPGIRCGVCHDHFTAMACREHNDANIVAFGSRVIGTEVAADIVRTFMTTKFAADQPRHVGRIAKIAAIEQAVRSAT